ncbi:MAG TPA: ligase-associated DNA damage response exonuclease [Polyangiaceae bacterium]|nr:ligase-associated DNA damage response exonuclease [Polyangiaceae bacterium]
MNAPLVTVTPAGLFCERGGFYIDPWRPVDRALLTHAHSDHARAGMGSYLAAAPGLPLLRKRLGPEARVETLPYGERATLGGVRVSFHPAGHVLGSAQIRLEAGGEVWVVTGDFKRAADPTCAPFEIVRCHTLITEATFALPIYRWAPAAEVAREALAWWAEGQKAGRSSILFCYALGKAQRLLAELGPLPDGRPVLTHGAVEAVVACYREAGVALPPTQQVTAELGREALKGALVLAPPSADGSPWLRRFAPYESAFASGWMRLRGARRRRSVDRGFVLSDHADWPALFQTVRDSGAERVLATHGYADVFARALAEGGLDARPLETAFEGEADVA